LRRFESLKIEFTLLSLAVTGLAMLLSVLQFGQAEPVVRSYPWLAAAAVAEGLVIVASRAWARPWLLVGISMAIASLVEVRANLAVPGEVLMSVPPIAVAMLVTQFDDGRLLAGAGAILLAISAGGLLTVPRAQWGFAVFSAPPWIYMAPQSALGSIVGLAATVSGLLVLLLALQRTTAQVSVQISREVAAQTTDRLTGVPNKAAWTRACRRGAGPGSVIVVDVDNFSRINDRFGMPAGDAALKEVAYVLRRHVREADWLFRFGGEEFVVFLRRCGQDVAAERAERLRVALRKHPLILGSNQAVQLTASFGVASGAYPLEALFRLADQGVYASKNGGKDRVSVVRCENAGRVGAMGLLLGRAADEPGRVYVAPYLPAGEGVAAGRVGEWRPTATA